MSVIELNAEVCTSGGPSADAAVRSVMAKAGEHSGARSTGGSQGKGSGSVSAETRVLVLHGSERYLQDQHLKILRDALEAEHGEGSVETIRFDGLQGQKIVADVMDECRSMGLMSGYKIVLVENADVLLKGDEEGEETGSSGAKLTGKRMKTMLSAREVLEGYTKDISSSATLVLRANVWRGGNLEKAILGLGDAGAVIKCEPPTAEEATTWAIRRCKKRHGAEIAADAARALIAAVGADLGRIDTELEKLALAAGGKGEPIGVELVNEMTGVTREDEMWGIQEKLLSGDAGRALEHLRLLLDVSRADPVPLVWAYADLARKIHTYTRGQSQGLSRQQLMGSVKVWGAVAEVFYRKVGGGKGIDAESAARLLRESVRTDGMGKGLWLGDPVRNLEMLTVKFAAATA